LGKGDLLGFAFALFAAAVARGLIESSSRRRGLFWAATAGLSLTALLIALVWADAFAREHPKAQLKEASRRPRTTPAHPVLPGATWRYLARREEIFARRVATRAARRRGLIDGKRRFPSNRRERSGA